MNFKMASAIQLVALILLCMLWLPDDCKASPSKGSHNRHARDEKRYDPPVDPRASKGSNGLSKINSDFDQFFDDPLLPDEIKDMLRKDSSTESHLSHHRNEVFHANSIFEQNVAEADRSKCLLIQFTRDVSSNVIVITLYRYTMRGILLRDARELKHEMATMTRLIFWVDSDLNALTSRDISRLTQMFQAMRAARIRLTFNLMAGGLHKLPISAIESFTDIDMIGRGGWSGPLILELWIGIMGTRLITLSLTYVSWSMLNGYENHVSDKLTINAHTEDDYRRYLRLLILSNCREFNVSLYDTEHKLVARWTKQKFEDSATKYMLIASLLSVKHATYLAKYLRVRKPIDLTYIDVMTEKSRDIFVEANERLLLALQPFEWYAVHEIASKDNGSRRTLIDSSKNVEYVNRIDVNGDVLNVELSTEEFVVLPAGERFKSIRLTMASKVSRSVSLQYGRWLAKCHLVNTLNVMDRGAGIVANALEQAVLAYLNKNGTNKRGLANLNDIELISYVVGWLQYLFRWYKLKTIKCYAETDIAEELRQIAKREGWIEGICSLSDEYTTLRCYMFTRY